MTDMNIVASLSPEEYESRPFVDGNKVLLNGAVQEWKGEVKDVSSPIMHDGVRVTIGALAQMGEEEAIAAVNAAKKAYDHGTGLWPQMKMEDRITAVQNLVEELNNVKGEIIKILQWEICKNTGDATAEFDRTMAFIKATIEQIRKIEQQNGEYLTVSGVMGKFRRNSIGTMLAMGPFNYPFNETYTTLIPSLLMGNTIVMKIPACGGLAHVLTMEAYAKCFPPGVMNFVSGQGRVTMGPCMKQGVDIFAFIGGSKAADAIIREHPAPHRVKTWLSLEGKNLAIVTQDADVDVAVEQCALGSLTYNGQRCTAIKLIFVHSSIAESFTEKFTARVAQLPAGLPWKEKVLITPLPEEKKPEYLQGLIEDATGKGATIVNEASGGGKRIDNIILPTILSPVKKTMRVWHEEQFGPVVPIAIFNDSSEIFEYIYDMPYGQQAAIFSTNEDTIAPYLDTLSTAVGRININSQCARSPDVFPFSGRRSSALGTLSITEALIAFSTETVIATKGTEENAGLMKKVESKSRFLAPISPPA